ncbi:alanine racemase [Georgenia sp. MJ173]|uniref:alanine racemase n=1 Tax=Georgenia sunbinii TaxID=3117728 RepID=UPI002F26CFFF
MNRSIHWTTSAGRASAAGSDAPALPRFRSLPDPGLPADQVGRQGWQLTDLLLPALTLRAGAIEHNVALHARWCASVGVSQAPHAKTHLSPEIVRLQLDSGAWGMSAATVHQARLLAAIGAPRVLIAHEVVDAANIAALARLEGSHPGTVVMTLVDSVEGVAALEQHLVAAASTRPLPVLVELGVPGGRSGARDLDALEVLAGAVHASPSLVLAGVEGFEGILPVGRTPEHLRTVDDYLAGLAAAAARLDGRGYFDAVEEIVLTAGGSVYPDRVAAIDVPRLSRPVRVVVRSGATATHDHGPSSANAPLAAEAAHPLGALRPALDLWVAVVSTPEPGLALAAFGKRDAPYDSHPPVVLEVRRDGEGVDAGAVTVERMNDQHGFLAHPDTLRVGDVVRLGPCHPCTAFDKWPLVAVLDDDDRVVGAATTWF